MAKALMNLFGNPVRFIAQGISIRRAVANGGTMNKSNTILADKTIQDELGFDIHSSFHIDNHSSFHIDIYSSFHIDNHSSFHIDNNIYSHLIYCSS